MLDIGVCYQGMAQMKSMSRPSSIEICDIFYYVESMEGSEEFFEVPILFNF